MISATLSEPLNIIDQSTDLMRPMFGELVRDCEDISILHGVALLHQPDYPLSYRIRRRIRDQFCFVETAVIQYVTD